MSYGVGLERSGVVLVCSVASSLEEAAVLIFSNRRHAWSPRHDIL